MLLTDKVWTEQERLHLGYDSFWKDIVEDIMLAVRRGMEFPLGLSSAGRQREKTITINIKAVFNLSHAFGSHTQSPHTCLNSDFQMRNGHLSFLLSR